MKLNLKYLYHGKARLLEERYELFKNAKTTLRCETIENATIIPPVNGSNDCFVMDSSGGIVDISWHDWEPDTHLPEIQSDTLDTVHGKVLFAGYFNSHWGHFLMETLTRLWPLFTFKEAEDCKIVYCIHKDEKPDLSGNISEALRLLGVADRISFISAPVKCESVIVGETGVYPREIFSPVVKCVYERLAEAALADACNANFSRKIYLSRGKLDKAIKNEAGLRWVDKWMEANGFEVLYPEKMNLLTLIAAVRNAEMVAAISGTLPHSMVFARENTRLLVLEKYPTINNYQQGIDLLFDLDVTMVDCGAFIRPVNPGLGPFILLPTQQLRDFAEDSGLTPPPSPSRKELKQFLKLFVKRFLRNYCRQWIMPHWLVDETGICCEAYNETSSFFEPWLNGDRPLFFREYFSPVYVGRCLKKRIKRFIHY